MSPEKVWNALAGYDRELGALGYVADQFTPEEYALKGHAVSRPRVYAHCRWMAQKCLSAFRAEFEAAWGEIESEFAAQHAASWPLVEQALEARKPLEKAMRWLAYIQGVCHVLGVYSCDELRDHSRGGEGEFKPAGEEHAARRYALAEPPESPYRGPRPHQSDAEAVAALDATLEARRSGLARLGLAPGLPAPPPCPE